MNNIETKFTVQSFIDFLESINAEYSVKDYGYVMIYVYGEKEPDGFRPYLRVSNFRDSRGSQHTNDRRLYTRECGWVQYMYDRTVITKCKVLSYREEA